MLNLLSLQAELMELSDELRQIYIIDEHDEQKGRYLYSFKELKSNPDEAKAEGNFQLITLNKIRTTLKDYSMFYRVAICVRLA